MGLTELGAAVAEIVASELDQEREQWYGFEVYTAAYRRQVIHFCGWTDVVVPRFMVGQAGQGGAS